MKEINKIKVSYNGKVVGSIIRYQRYLTAFAYDPEWLRNGFSISPFSLPLREEPFIAKQEPFDGLFGVFEDSLPDGWGRLLLDRLLLKNKINPHSVILSVWRLSAHQVWALWFMSLSIIFLREAVLLIWISWLKSVV